MQNVGHYRIVSKLGEGGMGTVYKAMDTHLDRFVALKIVRADLLADASRKSRFVREAKTASALNHPNVVYIYDINNVDGLDYIAMEYIDGTTLTKLIQAKPVPMNQAVGYALQIADGLASAHAAGIVHRDLKPDNVMINERGVLKILDFGLAKLVEGTPGEGAGGETRTLEYGSRTLPGVVMGTPAYMAPEQAEGRPVDARADIFSFGVLLYEMTTGVLPFRGDSPLSVMASVLRDEPRRVSELARVPPQWERLTYRCMRKDPNQRYQKMADVQRDLEILCEAGRSGAGMPAVPHRHWETPPVAAGADSTAPSTSQVRLLTRALRGLSVAAGVLALLALAATLWWFSQR